MRVSDALEEIKPDQRQRALANINAQLQSPQKHMAGQSTDEMMELFENIVQIQKPEHGTTDRNSQAGSTPPRIVQQADNGHNHNDDDDDEDEPWVLPVTRGLAGRKDNGGSGGCDDGGNQTNTNRNQREEIYGCNNTTEFALVNSRNMELKRFSGESGSKMTYLEFNESQRELISIKGKDGEVRDTILILAENKGDSQVTTRHLEQLQKMVPKIWEYDRAVHAALKNLTEGDAKIFIKYEVDGGVDAWRKLYIEYIPSEILDFKLVSEKNVRKLLNRMEEPRHKYNHCGGTPLGENIIKSMLVKCAPKGIMKPLAMHLDSTTCQQVRKLMMRQMHNELIGMFEGETTQPLYNLEKTEGDEEDKESEDKKAEEAWTKLEQDYWTAALNKGKGGKGGKGKEGKGKGKGYGEC